MSTLTRETKETRVRIELGSGPEPGDPVAGPETRPGVKIVCGDPFLSHMLDTLARYSGWRLRVEASGDLQHHLIEDVAITLGTVAGRDTPTTCTRYGDATIPMDEALVQVAVDTGGRPHYEGELPSDLYDHFFRSFALNADWTVHVRVLRGRDRHHIVEAAFKALGMAIRQAMTDQGGAVFSTKGSVATVWDDGLDEIEELGKPFTAPAPAPVTTARPETSDGSALVDDEEPEPDDPEPWADDDDPWADLEDPGADDPDPRGEEEPDPDTRGTGAGEAGSEEEEEEDRGAG